jgi:hypothetical protein
MAPITCNVQNRKPTQTERFVVARAGGNENEE